MAQMSGELVWAIVVAGGCVAGFLASSAWKIVFGFGGLALAFLIVAYAIGSARGFSAAEILVLEGGPEAQLVAAAYACALASLISAARIGINKYDAT